MFESGWEVGGYNVWSKGSPLHVSAVRRGGSGPNAERKEFGCGPKAVDEAKAWVEEALAWTPPPGAASE